MAPSPNRALTNAVGNWWGEWPMTIASVCVEGTAALKASSHLRAIRRENAAAIPSCILPQVGDARFQWRCTIHSGLASV